MLTKKLVIAVLITVTASFAFADEGMWMPQQVPQLADRAQGEWG